MGYPLIVKQRNNNEEQTMVVDQKTRDEWAAAAKEFLKDMDVDSETYKEYLAFLLS